MPAIEPEVRKTYWNGTHRIAAPAETIEQFAKHARALGITRLANVTGLDYLGIPVFMAVRPNARSLSVSQGKGLDAAAAAASAFMEAAELAHAECVAQRPRIASYTALKRKATVADPAQLPRVRGARFAMERDARWLKGRLLHTGEPIWVPYELVHLDYTEPSLASDCFLPGSNGLASGNHRLEAISAGLCEVIERDASRLWRLRDDSERMCPRLALDSVRKGPCRTLIDSLVERGIALSVWDATTDISIACFVCNLSEAPRNSRSTLGAFWGSGCHVNRDIALSRAITEAAQSRLTYIAGSRDDLTPEDYARPPAENLLRMAADLLGRRGTLRRFSDVPSRDHETINEDIEYLCERLRVANLEQVIVVDLTTPKVGIPVVRVIVPGLEADERLFRYRPGRRARALMTSLR